MNKKYIHIVLVNLLLLAASSAFGQAVTITSSGTWTVPAGVTSINLYLWGGGGAGGGSNSSGADFSNGGGGGGGACAVNTAVVVSPGQVWTVTIGAGGIGTTGAGGNGGSTTFVNGGTTYTVAGGLGAGAASTSSNTSNLGGAGGSTGTGTINAGGHGSSGFNGTSSGTGITGTGGGGAGSTTGGSTPANTCAGSGAGGTGTYPGGAGGYNSACNSTSDNAGTAGTAPGGGGSGNNDWFTGYAGGNGAAGQVVITYTLSVVTYTSNTTWTVPAGVNSASVYLWGGGGAGGGTPVQGTDFANGGGGGGGACSSNLNIPLTPGQVWTITIGNFSGSGGVGTTGAGGNGTATTFTNGGTTYSAAGGLGAAGASNVVSTSNPGGAGASTGTGVVTAGGHGSSGFNGSSSTTGITGTGGGAGGGGGGAAGASPASTCAGLGTGGTGTYPGGAGAQNPNCNSTTNSNGATGATPGGGGSGCNDWTGSATGGNGGLGQVLIDLSCSNSTPATSITASVNPVSCPLGSTTLTLVGGSLGTGATWHWYTVSCGGTAAGTGTSITVTPSVTTTYYVRAEGNCGNSACTQIGIIVSNTASTIATSVTASPSITCPGDASTLTVNGGSLGSGANWTWYTVSCGGTAAGTGATLAVSPATTTTYYVRAEGTCGNTGCVSAPVTVSNTVSVAATSASASVNPTCAGGATTLSITGGTLGTGATWQWYTGSCGGTSVGSGTSLAVSPAVTTTYWVRAEGTCGNSGCVSVTVNVTNTSSVAATSASPSVNNICPNGATTLSITGGSLGTGATWNWYTVSCGGTGAGAGATLAVTPAVTTTYYVRAQGTCNTTTCVSVTVTVSQTVSTPAASVAASASPSCPGGSSTLTLTGGTLGTGATWQWYTVSCGGTAAGSGTAITVTPAVTTTYYVRAEGACGNSACVSVTQSVTNTVSTPATSATASPALVCNASSTLSLAGGSLGTGAFWTWYSGSCGGGGTLIGTGASLVVTPASTTTYYVMAVGTCGNTTCASATVTVSGALPPIPNAGPDQFICGPAPGTAIMATTGVGTWTILNGTGTITTPASPVSAVTVTNLGTSVTFRWTVVNGCGSSYDDVVIYLSP